MGYLPEKLRNDYAYLINQYSSISVREKSAARMIEELINCKPTVVLDPTLLLETEDWLVITKSLNVRKPYILCYFLGDNPWHRKVVKRLKRQTGYSIVVIPIVFRDYFYGDKRVYNVSPGEFIDLIYNANIVCTDSYHGTIFSINFNKEFYTFLRFCSNDLVSENSRVIDFLSDFNLTERLIKENQMPNFNNPKINYDLINSKLDYQRKKSIQYIIDSLKRATK